MNGDVPTAWMGLCWNSEPTMVSQIMVEGMASVWSSSAVNLHTRVSSLRRRFMEG